MNDDFTPFNSIYNGLKSVLDDIECELDNDIVKEGQAGTDDGWSQEIPDDVFDTAPNILVQQIKNQEKINSQSQNWENGGDLFGKR